MTTPGGAAVPPPPRLVAALAERGIRLEAEAGRGAAAVVYRARDERHDRLVAVKVLRESVGAAVGAQRFAAEVAVAARLQHPNVVPLYDSGVVGDTPYYIMPFVEGESLRARLDRDGRLPVAEAARLGMEAADALAYAHRQGVVHRDVKPENILLEAGHAIVADFGVALALSRMRGRDARETASGMVVGTPAYMSPEQAAGEPVDGRSDVYSLGCVLYEALAGRPPFTGPDARSVLAQRFLRPPPPLRRASPEVPRAVERAILRALASEPSTRCDAAELASALERALAPERRARTGRITIAAVAVVPAVALGLTLLGPPPAPPFEQRRVVVAPFENRTGNPSLTPLGELAADLIATAAARDPRFEVLTPVRGTTRASAAGAAGWAATVVSGSYYRSGAVVEMLAAVSDARTGELARAVGPVRAPTRAGERLDRALSRGVMAALDSLARAAEDSAAVRALPVVEVPARADGDALAVLMTGDGDWATSVGTLADELAARGVAVVGLKARAYLTPGRTPEETAADVARILRVYGARWGRTRAALVGYSRGADALPFVATRLPPELRRRLALVAMLGPGLRANFHFHWLDLVRDAPRPDDLPTRPEIERLAGTGTRLLCVYGLAERESACREASPGTMRVVARPGAHHFDRDFRALGDLIADALVR